ncbi:MAG: hybrid sensor histidine kinase/response regulator [Roseateles sp.]|uniref:hybrid sensor histidine kinase/response regulator n=1 Tax=Roseateles sp. TaxID=1971397 RepID=UPI004035E7BF
MLAHEDADRSYSERVIVLAPTARDGDVTRKLLAEARIEVVLATGWRHAEALINEGAGALVLTDANFAEPGFPVLVAVLERQPGWSNLPVLALCRNGLETPALREARLNNVTMLDRPTSMRAMVSAVRTALRGRRWQYQIRDQIDSLMRADRSLRLADQRKDEFLATLAHELRNPLAPIRTGLQLLARPVQDETHVKSVMRMMDRQMSQLLRLIDDLLEVSRISTGKLVLQREPLDMRRVVEMALEACQPLIERGGHRLSVTLPDEALWVDGDLTRLSQSLSNLLNNAAKYTPDGGDIAVTLARADGQAVLAVRDSGVGLPQDMIARVFDMFAQVNRSLSRAQGGLGIGLALVRTLVTMHGGRVNAASAGPGLGSTFTIELPLAPEDSVPAPLAADSELEVVRPVRILVVDDNDDAATSLAMLLALSGHEVQVENSGQAALRKAAEFLPQAIFCDLGMPGIGGHEFATRLRQDERFASTLLVALTGWGSEEDKKRSRAAGFNAHLTKPAGMDAVSALLADL